MCRTIQTFRDLPLSPIPTQPPHPRSRVVQSLVPLPRRRLSRGIPTAQLGVVQIARLVAISLLPPQLPPSWLRLKKSAIQKMCRATLKTRHWTGATSRRTRMRNSSMSRCETRKTPLQCRLTTTRPWFLKVFPAHDILSSRISNSIFWSVNWLAVPPSSWFRDRVSCLEFTFTQNSLIDGQLT